jgi:hypothetical protein
VRFDRSTRTRVLVNVTTDIDPAGSTVELSIDDTWHDCTWQGTAVEASGRWTQQARTTGYFAGPDAVASGATVLSRGRHLTRTRVTKSGDILTAGSSPIDV